MQTGGPSQMLKRASQTTSDHYNKMVLEDTEYHNGYHVTVHACMYEAHGVH